MRMERASDSGFSGDISPEELHRAYPIQQALRDIESAGQGLCSEDSLERCRAAQTVLDVYNSAAHGLRNDIHDYATSFSRNGDGGTEPFAYTARLMVLAATTIAEAARQANDRTTLREVEVSLAAVMTGLSRSHYRGAEVLSIVLWRELSRIRGENPHNRDKKVR